MSVDCDVVVIGGGPAGSVCSAHLARYGHRVLLLERSAFPRDHVGESLSPAAWRAFAEMGLTTELDGAVFPPKTGATFIWGTEKTPWTVGYGGTESSASTAHVRRAELDQILLGYAERCGVTVRQGCLVNTVTFDGGRREVVYADEDGTERTASATWIVDAGGRATVLGRQLGLIDFHSTLKHSAAWGRWEGGRRLPDREADNTLFTGSGDTCLWYLPWDERTDVVSVGVVSTSPASRAGTGEERYLQAVRESGAVSALLEDAKQVSAVHTGEVHAYCCTRTAGPGWILVGEAAWFADSLLTPGVQLAVQQAILAARVVDAALDDPNLEEPALDLYDRECRRQYDTFARLAVNMYGALGNHSQEHGASGPPQVPNARPGSSSAAPPNPDFEGVVRFLMLISGFRRDQLLPRLGSHMMLRAKALNRVGAPPGPQEEEGFGFLSRQFHQELLAAARAQRVDGELLDDSIVRRCPGVRFDDELFVPKKGGDRLVRRPAVTNRFGDRFEISAELEALLGLVRDGCAFAGLKWRYRSVRGPETEAQLDRLRAWLHILADNALVEWQRWSTT